MRELAQEVGFTWEVHPVSNWSSTRYSSSFTSCVHEVALGATDICIGNFWMTAERLALASFSPPLYDDEFRLLVKEDKEIDYLEIILTPTLPFTFTAWTYIVLMVMYSSVALFIINKGEIMRLGEIEDDMPSLSDNIAHMIHIDKKRHRLMNWFENGIEGIVKASYFGLIGFTGMAPANETTNFPGRIVTAGFAIFLMIIGATYTGATAAALVSNQGGSNINSLDDVLKSGQNLCIRRAMSSNFLLRFPEFNGKLQMQDKMPEILTDMDDGKCLAAIIMSDGWDKIVASSPEHCSGSKAKKMLDQVLMSSGNGMPIRDELSQPLSFVIAANIQAAKYFALQNEYKAEKVGFSSCNTIAAVGEDGTPEVTGFKSMTEMDMFAPFAITFVMTTVGLLVFCACGYVGLHIEDAGLGGVTNDALVRKELEELSRSALRDRAMAHIADDDTDVHNASIKNSGYSLAHDANHHKEGVTRTEEEEVAYQLANVLTRRKVYDAVNEFPDKVRMRNCRAAVDSPAHIRSLCSESS
jgi:ABC-type amino acid transport substrate-binding protein